MKLAVDKIILNESNIHINTEIAELVLIFVHFLHVEYTTIIIYNVI